MLTAVWTPEGTQIKIVNNGHKQKIFWNGKSDESLVNLQGASEQTGQLKDMDGTFSKTKWVE